MNPEAIFIGGTGRSGTTIVKAIMSRHSQVYAVPHEIRFICDPDGLMALASCLTEQWSPVVADAAFGRFLQLMDDLRHRHAPLADRALDKLRRVTRDVKSRRQGILVDTVSPERWVAPSRYSWSELAAHVGPEHFDMTMDWFYNELDAYQFEGYWTGSTNRKVYPKVFGAKHWQRVDLMPVMKEFIDRLLEPLRHGKRHWCEDTPTNFLHAPFLLELYPAAKIVHVFRDPRDVIASMRGQPWAPRDLQLCTRLVREQIETWCAHRQQLPKDSFVEFKFEDLIANPHEQLESLCAALGIEFEDQLESMNLSAHNVGRFRDELSVEQQSYIEDSMAPWMQENNYGTVASG